MLFHVVGASLKKELVKAVHSLGGKGTRSPNDKIIARITTKGMNLFHTIVTFIYQANLRL